MAAASDDVLDEGDLGDDLRKLREEREERNRKDAVTEAENTLKMAAANPVRNRSKQWNLTADERRFVQQVLSDPSNGEMAAATKPPKVFPTDGKTGKWTKLFYRLLDSLQGPDGERLRAIEMDLFHSKFKVVGWTGSREQNRAVDKKIAAAIRSSLQQYEKNTKSGGYTGQFFKFSKF